MYIAYVLTDNSGRFYKGMTADLDRRLKEHTKGQTKTTRKMSNIRVVYTESFPTMEGARKREVYFKTAAGRRFLKKVIQNQGH